MNGLSIQTPSSRLDRVRRGLTVFGTLMVLLLLPQTLGADVATAPVLAAAAAILGVVGVLLFTAYTRGRWLIALVPISAALAVVVGRGLDDAVSVVQLCIALVIGQTMYGSRASIVLRVAVLIPVVPLSVAFSASPVSRAVAWNAESVFSALPAIAVFAGLIYLLRHGLESQASTIARESFMAKLSSGLLAANTVQQIVPVMVQANADLLHLSPGLITLELQRIGPGESGPEGGARTLNIHGDLGGRAPEIITPEALTELPALGVERSQPLRTGSDVLIGLGLPPRGWYAIALERDPRAPCDLVLHGVRTGLGRKLFGVLSPEEVEFQIIIKLMSDHWRAAMVRVEQRAVLLEAQEQDDVTGLPDRSATMRKIVELVHSNDSRAGLILLELAGLDRIEAEAGLAAADVAMNQLAYRIYDLVEDKGIVGRGGDASFAVLLSEVGSSDELELLVERLENALLEPVLLPGGAMSLALRVGAARSAEGGTAVELLENAVNTMA